MAIDDNTSYELTGLQVKDLAQKVKAKVDSSSLAAVATSGDYTDLLNTPTIPTVNDATLTITQNGTTAGTFTANSSSDTTISLTDTTYTHFTGATAAADGTQGLVPGPLAGDDTKFLSGDGTWKTVSSGSSYTAGNGISIDANNEISIDDTVVAELSDLPTDFTGATSSVAGAHGLVPAPSAGDQDKVLHGDGTWAEPAAKLVEMSYGESNAWAKFIAAYNAGSIVYCRASSNANPATGSQTRKAFMAYVNNATSPTSVEFQYVRSVSSKTDSQQCDQVFVYTLTNASGGTWSVVSRNMAPKINVSGPITKTFSNGANATVTIGADTMAGATSSTSGTAGVVPAPAAGDDTKVLSGAGTWVAQPTVNDATLTIQRNGTNVDTFTANASSNKTIDIDVHNGVMTAWDLVPTADTTAGWRALFPTDGHYVTMCSSASSFSNKPSGWGILTTDIAYDPGSTTNFEIFQIWRGTSTTTMYRRNGNHIGWFNKANDSGSFTLIEDGLSVGWHPFAVTSVSQAAQTGHLPGRSTFTYAGSGQGGINIYDMPSGVMMYRVKSVVTLNAAVANKNFGISNLKSSTTAYTRWSGIVNNTTKAWTQYGGSTGTSNYANLTGDAISLNGASIEYTAFRGATTGGEWSVTGKINIGGQNSVIDFMTICTAKDATSPPYIYLRGINAANVSSFMGSLEVFY